MTKKDERPWPVVGNVDTEPCVSCSNTGDNWGTCLDCNHGSAKSPVAALDAHPTSPKPLDITIETAFKTAEDAIANQQPFPTDAFKHIEAAIAVAGIPAPTPGMGPGLECDLCHMRPGTFVVTQHHKSWPVCTDCRATILQRMPSAPTSRLSNKDREESLALLRNATPIPPEEETQE